MDLRINGFRRVNVAIPLLIHSYNFPLYVSSCRDVFETLYYQVKFYMYIFPVSPHVMWSFYHVVSQVLHIRATTEWSQEGHHPPQQVTRNLRSNSWLLSAQVSEDGNEKQGMSNTFRV